MNLRMYTIALLVSALPSLATAATVKFDRQDFISSERVDRDGKTVVRLKLSKSGKAKVKNLKVGDIAETEFGNLHELKVRAPIKDESVEMGPFDEGETSNILSEFK